jgi:fluoride exporter
MAPGPPGESREKRVNFTRKTAQNPCHNGKVRAETGVHLANAGHFGKISTAPVAPKRAVAAMQGGPAALWAGHMAADITPLFASLNVAAGGAVGALARFHLGRAVSQATGPGAAFPWATFAVNVLGCLAMGLLAGWLARGSGHEAARLLLGVGLLGGFTTFSAFGLEMVGLFERGSPGLAVAYALASVIAGVMALWLGLYTMRGLA